MQISYWKRAGVTALLAGMVLVGAGLPASAHSLGGHYPHSRGQWLYLPTTNPSGAYTANISQAQSNWFNTPTRIYPYATTNYTISRIDYYTGYYGSDWWGATQTYNTAGQASWTGTYSWANIWMNRSNLGTSQFRFTKVATHEMGHGFGLAHASWWDTSVMKQGDLGYNKPQQHDINDANIEYPW